jgi:PAS domain S-box-containing protein
MNRVDPGTPSQAASISRGALQDPQDRLDFLSSLLTAPTDQAVIGLDGEGTIVLWSEAAHQRYGYDAAEVVGKADISLLHVPEERESGRPAQILDFARTHGAWQGIVVRVRKNDERFSAKVLVRARQTVDGATIGFVVVTSEMPADRFRGLLESAPDGMVIVDSEGTIVLVNSQTERLFGYRREELVGRPVEVLVPTRSRARHSDDRTQYSAAPRVRGMGTGLDLHALHKDGREIPVEISLSPLETEEGRLVSASIRDVSDRKKVERALQEKNVELERANRAKDRFLATMSHELRTPLNAVIGFTGTLLMRLPGPLTDEQEHQLRIVQSSAKHLLSLINDLLDVAKIESGHAQIAVEPIDCAALVKEVGAELRPLALQKGLAFQIVTPDAPVITRADRRALRQVVVNLTNNAIKFTDRGEIRVTVTVMTTADGTAAAIHVMDTGIGIRPEDHGKLFRAFSQLEGPSGKPQEGTGLGLVLSRRLSELMGGTLSFESEWGTGSTFSLVLPV